MLNWDIYRRKTGLVIVFSGPSGVGKDCVIAEFTRQHPEIRRCITVTTRAPRPQEIPGVDYHFISEEEFRQKVDEGYFLEYAEVHNHLYGTPRPWVEERMKAGEDSILKIDVQGGISVKKQLPDAIMVFLVPPSLEELERRLRSRATDSEAAITKRLQDARNELQQIPEYEYIIENDTIQNAVDKLRSIIIAEHSRIILPNRSEG